MNISTEEISSRLVSTYGYSERDAPGIAKRLLTSTPRVQAAFERWWHDGELDFSLSVEGYTPQRLVDEYDFTPANALLTMDWLLREPKKALQALRTDYDAFLKDG